MGVFEIVLGGARPVVLTFLAAIFASPIPIHLDAARRERQTPPPRPEEEKE